MFYTINLSLLLVIKKGFIMIIILSDYQQCPLPLMQAWKINLYQDIPNDRFSNSNPKYTLKSEV